MTSTIDPWLREVLRCPVTHAELLDVVDETGAAALRSSEPSTEHGGALQYPIRDGIPVLLVDEAVVVS